MFLTSSQVIDAMLLPRTKEGPGFKGLGDPVSHLVTCHSLQLQRLGGLLPAGRTEWVSGRGNSEAGARGTSGTSKDEKGRRVFHQEDSQSFPHREPPTKMRVFGERGSL